MLRDDGLLLNKHGFILDFCLKLYLLIAQRKNLFPLYVKKFEFYVMKSRDYTL